jgi:phenylacetate-CoA ligase
MFNNQPSELPRFIEGCKRFQPVSIAVLNNPLLGALEQLFERTGTDPKDAFGSMKGALFGGEVLSPRQRALAAGWGIELFEMTSLGDICNSIDCRAHDGFHAWEDMVLVECLEPGGNTSMPDGEIGELVVTSLRSSFMPMIRFRTDDLVTLNRAPCACGRTHVRFKVLGRAGDSMVVGDRRVLPRDVQAIVETHGETRRGLFQIIRTGPQADVLRLRVGYDPDQLSDSTDSLAGRLRAELAEWLGAPVELEMVLDAELLKLGPPHKIPRVAKS